MDNNAIRIMRLLALGITDQRAVDIDLASAEISALSDSEVRAIARDCVVDGARNLVRMGVRVEEVAVRKPQKPTRRRHPVGRTEIDEILEIKDPEEYERRLAEEDARSARFRAGLQQAIDGLVKELRAEWTAELLAMSFALGDGTTVTWGAATADQHADRAALLQRQSESTLETAALHLAAIRDIKAAKATCLAGLEVVAA